MTHTQEQFDRLPKWAQAHIRSLSREVERAHIEAKVARLETVNPSDVVFLKETYAKTPIALPKTSRIVFKTPEGEIRVFWDERRRHVEVMANSESGEDLIVRPHVSNAVSVRLVKMP